MKTKPSVHAIPTPSTRQESFLAMIFHVCQRIHNRLLKVIAEVREQMRKR